MRDFQRLQRVNFLKNLQKPQRRNCKKQAINEVTQKTLQTFPVTRNHVGALSFKTGTSLATIPIRSGLRLLSIVSTETSQNMQISRDQLDPSKAPAKTPTTKYGCPYHLTTQHNLYASFHNHQSQELISLLTRRKQQQREIWLVCHQLQHHKFQQ